MDARIDTSARAWAVLAAAFGAMFTVFGVAYSFGVFFDPMAREFGSGRAATAPCSPSPASSTSPSEW
jgi:hypothetical protein